AISDQLQVPSIVLLDRSNAAQRCERYIGAFETIELLRRWNAGEPKRFWIEQWSNVVKLFEFLARQRPHEKTESRSRDERAFRHERAKRLAQRRAAHAEVAREVDLVDARAICEPAVDDHGAYRICSGMCRGG